MKNLIVVAFFLPLVIIINARDEEYQFGDIISFLRTKKCFCCKFTFKHYVIYVGNKTINGKDGGQDIFHRAGPSRTESTCIFGKLSEENGKPMLDNYLDDCWSVGNDQEILDRINEKTKNCEDYKLLKDNCEHLATYVRYGKKCSKQCGTWAARAVLYVKNSLCHLARGRRSEPQDNTSLDYEGKDCEELCRLEGSKKSD